jgi:glycosyltransferase involved in cell wall biosynthesis
MTVDLSVIMPALNEQDNIESAIRNTLTALDEFKINAEIVVINDGSKDKTGEVIADLMQSDPRIRTVRHDRPQGIGASFWDGVDSAQGEAVVMLPADNENDPWEIFRYYRLLEHVDIVIPFIFNKQERSLFRNTLSFVYRFIINTTFLANFNYTNGTVLYRRSLLKEIKYRSHNFFFQTYILVRSVKKGYLFAEVPYRLGLRKTGVSKAVTFPSLFQVMGGYLRLVRDYYFSKHNKKKMFTSDSMSYQRYK